jgi:hypothetical protein
MPFETPGADDAAATNGVDELEAPDMLDSTNGDGAVGAGDDAAAGADVAAADEAPAVEADAEVGE